MDWEFFAMNWEFAILFMVVGVLGFIGALPFCFGMSDLAKAVKKTIKRQHVHPSIKDSLAPVAIGLFLILMAVGLAIGGSYTITEHAKCDARGYVWENNVCYSNLERAE